jgi:hypothetical protein
MNCRGRSLMTVAGLLLGLALGRPAGPALADEPAALPDLAVAQSTAYRQSAYPDWSGRVLREATLAERRRSEGGVIGTLSLQAAQPGWVSVLYYSETGQGYNLLDALPLPASQHTQLTFPLPPGDNGLTRLIVWQRQPEAEVLVRLEHAALDAQRRTGGLSDERWFARTTPGAVAAPTDERLRYERAPAGILRSRTPYVWATLGPDGVASAKNCAVQYSGPTRIGMDNWGAFGQWQLGVGGSLKLQFVLPSRREFNHAVLRVQGQLSGQGPGGRPALLQLDLDGRRIGETPPAGAAGTVEQLSFDLSQTIGYGLNTLSLRNGAAGGGGDWLLQNIELWVE